MVPSAYADNKQKAEDDSAAAIADCDDNEVERAGFDCLAIAANDVEIETEPPSEEPPGEGLLVCKVLENPPQGVTPGDFELFLTDSSGFEIGMTFESMDCHLIPVSPNEGDMSPGAYTITELVLRDPETEIPDPDSITVEGDCTQIDPPDERQAAATGVIQEGESRTCTFINTYEDDS